MKRCIEGSRAIAEAVGLCEPDVVAAYPITPQTHIVEELSKFVSDGQAGFQFVRAESEFAAASIVLGASATGSRTYTASSSQGLLLMTEVIFTIAGMRLPVVMTVANRAVSAPINIWNDNQDYMIMRDSGWISLFAENNQEAVDFHFIAYKLAERLKLPVMINVDGFVLTHTYEPVDIPEPELVKKYLTKYIPDKDEILDVNNPVSLGCFVTPSDYMQIREDLDRDLKGAKKEIKKEFLAFKNIFGRARGELIEYYGDKKADTVFVTMGSVVGTVKDAVDEINALKGRAAVVKLKCFRPFPSEDLRNILKNAKYIAVLDKNISLGSEGALATEVKAALAGHSKAKVQSFIVGLGGRDVTRANVRNIYKIVRQSKDNLNFIY